PQRSAGRCRTRRRRWSLCLPWCLGPLSLGGAAGHLRSSGVRDVSRTTWSGRRATWHCDPSHPRPRARARARARGEEAALGRTRPAPGRTRPAPERAATRVRARRDPPPMGGSRGWGGLSVGGWGGLSALFGVIFVTRFVTT